MADQAAGQGMVDQLSEVLGEDRERRINERRRKVQQRLQAQGGGTPGNVDTDAVHAECEHPWVSSAIQDCTSKIEDAIAVGQAEVHHQVQCPGTEGQAMPMPSNTSAVAVLQSALTNIHEQSDTLEQLWEGLSRIESPWELAMAVQAATARAEWIIEKAKGAAVEAASASAMLEEAYKFKLLRHMANIDSTIQCVWRTTVAATMQTEDIVHRAENLVLDQLMQRKSDWKLKVRTRLDEYVAWDQGLFKQRQRRWLEREEAVSKAAATHHCQHAALWLELGQSIDTLWCEIASMKAANQLLADKLEYNCHVLAERKRENKVVLVAQKRKLNELGQVLSGLRSRHAEMITNMGAELNELAKTKSDAEQKLHALEAKEGHFAKADEVELQMVIELRECEMRQLMDRLNAAKERLPALTGINILEDLRRVDRDIAHSKQFDTSSKRDRLNHDPGVVVVASADGNMCANTACGWEPQDARYWRAKVAEVVTEDMKLSLSRLEEVTREGLQIGQRPGEGKFSTSGR